MPENEKTLVTGVLAALESDKDLVRDHRGYVLFLDQHPEVASAEEAFTDLTTLSGFRAAVWVFDEALWRERAHQDRFDRYYACLAKNGRLRETVDSLHRLEFEYGALCREHKDAMTYLRAHPDQAIAFLQRPSRLIPVPDVLVDLAHFLKRNSRAQDSLSAAFREIDREAAAHTDVFPWWKSLADPAGTLYEPYRGLSAHFSKYPPHFWVWHRYNELMAQDPHTRDWLRYWNRRTRHAKGLGWSYAEYSKLLRDKPEYRRAAEENWAKQFGPAPEWPPEGSPPWFAAPVERSSMNDSGEIPRLSTKKNLAPFRSPEKPHIPGPTPPTPPKRPTMPRPRETTKKTTQE